jgi:plasmid maintenance system antidote protein VapI
MGISADSALRLAKAPNTSVQFWLGLQAQYDVEVAKLAMGNQLDSVRRVNETA